MTLDINNVQNFVKQTNQDIDDRELETMSFESPYIKNPQEEDSTQSRLVTQALNEIITRLTAEKATYESNTNSLEYELSDVTNNFILDMGISF